MKAALESHGGIKGCRAAVVEVETIRERNKDSKILGISVLNNFHYEEFGIRVWKAYDIAPRRLIPYSGLGVTPQGDTGLSVIKPFGQATRVHRGSVGESVRHPGQAPVRDLLLPRDWMRPHVQGPSRGRQPYKHRQALS